MKKIIKNILKLPMFFIFFYLKLIKLINLRSYHFLNDHLAKYTQEKKKKIKLDDKNIYIFTPNELCEFRANTFYSKEPETINWIRSYGKNGVLYDIGANIGLYSIFHALTNNSKSYAFEPSVFNLMQLTKNININNCNKLISLIPNPLSNTNSVSEFNYTSDIEGGALSSFGVDYNHEGKKIKKKLSLDKIGFNLDDLVFKQNLIEKPNLIKIDVDGIEHLILEGSRMTLKENNCKTVLVEINDEFKQQSEESRKILQECGFKIKEKGQSRFTKNNYGFEKTYNQIWYK